MEGVEFEIERGLGGFPANMRGAELEILLHLEAFDLPVVEANVWRNRTVGEALLDRIAADARPEDGERGTGDAVLRDASVGEEGVPMPGEHDDLGSEYGKGHVWRTVSTANN